MTSLNTRMRRDVYKWFFQARMLQFQYITLFISRSALFPSYCVSSQDQSLFPQSKEEIASDWDKKKKCCPEAVNFQPQLRLPGKCYKRRRFMHQMRIVKVSKPHHTWTCLENLLQHRYGEHSVELKKVQTLNSDSLRLNLVLCLTRTLHWASSLFYCAIFLIDRWQ